MKWRRREKGSYIAASNGERIAIVNMKRDGPNAPAWQGPQPAWEVRLGGSGDYDIGAKPLGHHWTLADAQEWAETRFDSVPSDDRQSLIEKLAADADKKSRAMIGYDEGADIYYRGVAKGLRMALEILNDPTTTTTPGAVPSEGRGQ